MHPTTILALILSFAAGQAFAAPQRNSNAIDTFGNAGVACTVGNDEGECDEFGRCSQFIPPNENSILNQGRLVGTCTAGGPVGSVDGGFGFGR
ncbi:hypothetical protein K458DRAFT_34434 [Lentithecium fluviatile CBS 122367]|uniref:Uncharacterized protein n=1 Tax=Lentithecium fluviatile CBS 122367 TaxID=1168545 RepID=A0A6G1J3A8_9PLEO|nr:hypothetical protein K458DRAFT_34434 [Lentithecium fluviatile CBS 122367]